MFCYGTGRGTVRNRSIPTPDYSRLSKATYFSKTELMNLFDQYTDLCDESGMFLKERFLSMHELQAYFPILELVHYRETLRNNSSHLTFERFADVLSTFSIKASSHEKTKCTVLRSISWYNSKCILISRSVRVVRRRWFASLNQSQLWKDFAILRVRQSFIRADRFNFAEYVGRSVWCWYL